jgi:hypothetical protein
MKTKSDDVRKLLFYDDELAKLNAEDEAKKRKILDLIWKP